MSWGVDACHFCPILKFDIVRRRYILTSSSITQKDLGISGIFKKQNAVQSSVPSHTTAVGQHPPAPRRQPATSARGWAASTDRQPASSRNAATSAICESIPCNCTRRAPYTVDCRFDDSSQAKPWVHCRFHWYPKLGRRQVQRITPHQALLAGLICQYNRQFGDELC